MTDGAIGIALSVATLLVIAATAVAAIVQMRHLRTGNQLSALLEILDQWNQPALQAAYSHFARNMDAQLADPAYVKLLESPGSVDRGTHPEFLVFDLWEQVGTYVKHGLIDEKISLDIAAAQIINAWKRAWPAVKIMRVRLGAATFENFEYLVVRAVLFDRRHPNGTYPAGLPRITELSARALPHPHRPAAAS